MRRRSPMDHDTVPRVDGKGGLYGATPGKMQVSSGNAEC